MIWRISKALKSGPVAYDATWYLTEAEALAVIEREFKSGHIVAADMTDQNNNRIAWDEIKQRLGLPEKED